MTSREKEYERIKHNPNNVSFEKLEKLLITNGFEKSWPRGGSSHCTFSKGKMIITIPFAKPIKEIYVKQVIEMIEADGGVDDGKES